MTSDFSVRGFHIDLRIQPMPVAALRTLADELAAFGLNTLLIEWEATYPYDRHATISNEYAYTRDELKSFVSYCADLGVQVIPLQQCFGHVEYILRHERYAHLRESNKDLCQLCPLKEKAALQVFRELLEDVASTHPAPYIHIGGDETYLLGHCQDCKAKAQREGKSKLYVDYFSQIAHWIVRLGRRPLIWADMLLRHPEAAALMPKECVFVDWNYGWASNRFGDLAEIPRNGFELWGAAALRASPDNHSLTSWKRHFDNIRDYIPNARRRGCPGILLTSWSTSGTYGYEWDQPGEVTEMFPTRHVYPLSGFRMLLAAYAESLQQRASIVPEDFVKRYAVERFGLSPRESGRLWRALTLDATPIQPGTDLEALYEHAQKARQLLSMLHPCRNEREFAHLRLMADFREFHARFKKVEGEIQSPAFSSSRNSQAVRALARLIEESEALDERFMELNKGFLYDRALLEEIQYRSKKLRKLYERLSRLGRKRQPIQVPISSSRSLESEAAKCWSRRARPASPIVRAESGIK